MVYNWGNNKRTGSDNIGSTYFASCGKNLEYNIQIMASRKVTTLPVVEKTVCQTNADQKRSPIDRIIIHTEVGTQVAADHRFNDCASKVSAHYGVGLDGSIWHWVDEDWVAYHAGDYPMNQRSIGIEHEDNGLYNDPRPDALYTSSSQLVADICKFYSIPCDRQHIIKHSEVPISGTQEVLYEQFYKYDSQHKEP